MAASLISSPNICITNKVELSLLLWIHCPDIRYRNELDDYCYCYSYYDYDCDYQYQYQAEGDYNIDIGLEWSNYVIITIYNIGCPIGIK